MSPIGDQLREAREARGLRLDELARRTRIKEAYLQAIEEGRDEDLPEGPWRVSWIRVLCEELDVEEPIVYVEAPEPRVPLNVVRALGLGTLFTVIILYSWHRWGPVADQVVQAPVPRTRDQHVELTARRSVHVKAWVDGEQVMDGRLGGGDQRSFDAYDRVELEVGAVEAVRLRYNGRGIVPQGRQDAPRRLAFIDDEGT